MQRVLTISLVLLGCCSIAMAADQHRQPIWGIGAMAQQESGGFVGGERGYSTVPYLLYQGRDWRVQGNIIERNMFRSSAFSWALGGHIDRFGYGRNEQQALSSLPEIKPRYRLHSRVTWNTPYGEWSGRLSHDVSHESDGTNVDITWRYPMHFHRFSITPFIEATWMDENENHYLWGVDKAQQTTKLSAYDATHGTHRKAGVSWRWPLSSQWILNGYVQRWWLNNRVADSPLLVEDTIDQAGVGLLYLMK